MEAFFDFKDPASIETYIKAGQSTFSIKSESSNTVYKFKVQKATHVPYELYYVKAKVLGSGRVSYDFIGVIEGAGSYLVPTPKSKSAGKSNIALNYLLWNIYLRKIHDKITFIPSNMCCRCNRQLTTPESVALGVGPECAKKINKYA